MRCLLLVACVLALCAAVSSAAVLRGNAAASLSSAAALPPSMDPYVVSAAVEAVYLSGAAYCGASLGNWTCVPCERAAKEATVSHSDVLVFQSSFSTYGYVAYDSKRNRVIIGFRGTTNLENWITNIRTTHTEFFQTGAQVHTGFYSAYLSVREQVFANMDTFLREHRGARIQVVGHSLGGALATLCAVDIALTRGIDNIESFTYGSPRVGGDQFAALYLKHIKSGFRVVHYADIVPSLPPSYFGFQHVEEEVWYNEKSTSYQICAAGSNDCSILATSIADHLHYLNLPISGMCADGTPMVVGSEAKIKEAVHRLHAEGRA